MKRNPMLWSRSEKALLGVSAAVILGGAAFTFTLQHRDDLPVVAIPTPVMPSPNAFDYFDRARSLLVDTDKVDFAISSSHTPSYTPDDHPYTLAEKERLVAENAAGLKVMRQGFAYPYLSPPVRSYSTTLPYFARDRQLARQLMLEEQVKAGRGDWGGAVGTGLDAIDLGLQLPHGGGLIGDLVGIACQAIGRRQLWAYSDHLSAVQARAAARRLEALESRQVSFADTMQEEKWSGQAGLLELMHRPDWRNHVGALIGMQPEDLATRRIEARLAFTSDKTIMADYTRMMEEVIQRARLPYTPNPPPLPTPTDSLVPYLVETDAGTRLRDADDRAQNALLLTTFALRAYKMEHGAYPATLAALTPGYLNAIPDDPFAVSGPVRYRLSAGHTVLYSVGPDGKDDGGAPICDRTKSGPASPGGQDSRAFTQADSIGDIVAGINIY